MINGVHHISLATADLDRMLAFYRDLLGLSEMFNLPLKKGDLPFETVVGLKDVEGRVAYLRTKNVLIEIFQYTNPSPESQTSRPPCDVGIRHICFDVTDIFPEYERLVAAGMTFVSEPQEFRVKVRSAYLYDPDGNFVELQEILEGSPVERSHLGAI